MMKKNIISLLLIKPQKIGIEVKNNKVTILAYSSRIFRGLNGIIQYNNDNNLSDFYEEFNTSDLKNLKMKNNLKIISEEQIKIQIDKKIILPIGNIARNKKNLMEIYNTPLNKFHKIDTFKLKVNDIFKDFTIKKREILNNNDFGVKIISLGDKKYYMGTNNKVIQLIKMKPFAYEKYGKIESNIEDYKFPKIIRSLMEQKDVHKLYITDTEDYVLFGTNTGLILFTPKELFKYGIWDIKNSEKGIIEKNLEQKNNLVIELSSIKDILSFINNNGENIYFNVNKKLLKIKTNTAYRVIEEVLKIKTNNFNEEFQFALKTDIITKILKNKNIKYLILNFNTTTVAFTDHYDLKNAYNIYLVKTLKNF